MVHSIDFRKARAAHLTDITVATNRLVIRLEKVGMTMGWGGVGWGQSSCILAAFPFIEGGGPQDSKGEEKYWLALAYGVVCW